MRHLDPAHFFRSTFSHGIHPDENKHFTAAKPIQRLPFPPELVLPLSQHAGKPSKPLVHKGQVVVRGEPIAEADGFMSVPLHAPATGVIRSIELTPTAKGPRTMSILLKVYPGESQEVLYGSPRDVNQMTPEEIRILAETGTQLVHSPVANMKMATGILPLPDVLDAGVNVALGTDSAASNWSLSMLDEIRRLLKLRPDISPQEAFAMATVNGAQALNQPEHGKLTEGGPANAVAIKTDGARTLENCFAKDSRIAKVWLNGQEAGVTPASAAAG